MGELVSTVFILAEKLQTRVKTKLVIVFLTFGAMFVNILPLCVAAIQRQSAALEAKDKGLAGQILCEASSKIDFRTTAQWTVNVFPHACMCGVLKSTASLKHYLSDVTKIVPALQCH